MEGKCCKCDNINPKRQDVMLDPDQVDELKKTPGLSLSVLMPGHNHFTPSHPEPEVPMSFPRGQARKSSKEFQPVDLGKTSGLLDDDISFSSHDSNKDFSIVEVMENLLPVRHGLSLAPIVIITLLALPSQRGINILLVR